MEAFSFHAFVIVINVLLHDMRITDDWIFRGNVNVFRCNVNVYDVQPESTFLLFTLYS